VSIPRDLLVDVPEHGLARINAVPRIVQRRGEDALEALGRVVSDTLAVPVGHVVAIDLGAFESLVDAVEGVDVDVPCPIVDVFHDPRADGGLRTLSVEPGRRHFDGATAAMYARSRHGRSDFSRARRQQAVLLALRAKLLRERDPTKIAVLYEALARTVRTDLTRGQALGLALQLSHVGVERLHGLVLGARAVTPAHTEDGRSVLVPIPDGIRATLAATFDAPSPGTLPARHVCHDADAALRPR
jgi:LCP family protein required for cell wall assembly